MIPEFGTLFLIFGLFISFLQSSFIFFEFLNVTFKLDFYDKNVLSVFVLKLNYSQFICVILASFCLLYSLLCDDFSVLYVGNNSNSELPLYYKVSSFWSAHEGSLLLWLFLLSTFIFFTHKTLDNLDFSLNYKACICSVLGCIAFIFFVIILFTANPFVRAIINQPVDGSDLNPLLQDIGLILHPPLLYTGYAATSVLFSFAVTSLFYGKLSKEQIDWVSPFVVISWSFLTLGITLGSWWAYYELGWGGWWFWDPVENASLLPWLTTTILIHNLVLNKGKKSYVWLSLVLMLVSFLFCLLGTFLVRSGAVSSVHAFAVDVARGYTLFFFFSVVTLISILLGVFRLHNFYENKNFNIFSKGFLLLLVNFLFFLLVFFILVGTLFPVVIKFIFNMDLFVNAVFFNKTTLPIFYILLLLLPLSLRLNWYGFNKLGTKVHYLVCFFFVICFVLFLYFFYFSNIINIIYIIFLCITLYLIELIFYLKRNFFNMSSFVKFVKHRSSMFFAHLGFIFIVLGVVITSFYSVEKNISFTVGNKLKLENIEIYFDSIIATEGSNYIGYTGKFIVYNNKLLKTSVIYPEKRIYLNSGLSVTEVGINATMFYDIYIGLGESIGDDTWSCKVQYKPFIRFIWLGGFFMFFGGLFRLLLK